MTLVPRIHLISWNLHGLPFRGGRARRLGAAAEVFRQRRPDLILLQEIWVPRDAHRLAAWLATAGHRAIASSPGHLRRRGGLLAFVRGRGDWSVDDADFSSFTARAPLFKVWEGDGLGGKGIQQIVLRHAGGLRLVILHTHLQAQYGRARYADVRLAQIREVCARAREVPAGDALVAAGDFNTAPDGLDDELYQELMGAGWTDLGEPARGGRASGTSLERGREARIDYVLLRSPRGWRACTDLDLVRNEAADRPVSDHHGLDAQIEWRPDLDHAGSPAIFGLTAGRPVPMK